MTWERWQWRGALHSPKLQHYLNLTTRLFSDIALTFVAGGLTPLQRHIRCILQPQPTGQSVTVSTRTAQTFLFDGIKQSNGSTDGSPNLDQKTIIQSTIKIEFEKIVDFAVLADHRIKLKECETKNKYLDFHRELKKLWDMKMTVIPIVIGAFGTVTKGLLKGL